MNQFSPDVTLSLSNTGKAFVFDSKKPGKTIVFRAELDALPISENSNLSYISKNNNISHACGHDGHMAILAGLAMKISEERPQNGKVIILFQPAEEVEQGARDIVNDPLFIQLKPDYVYALHNVPGIKKSTIILKQGSFASASKGMTIKLLGKTSHAAEPENGISPANALARIILKFHELRDNNALFDDFILLTVIHASLGEIAFGTSPGYAELRVTLRAFENNDMIKLTSNCESIIQSIALEEHLAFEISYNEEFPATVNHSDCYNIVEVSAEENGFLTKIIDKPFKWSEDFGYFSEKYKSCFFGLGSGLNQPQLHNPDYNFPDEIIETGVKMFFSIYKNSI